MDQAPTVPVAFDYSKQKDRAVASSAMRTSLPPSPGSVFYPGDKMIFSYPVGSPGTHLDPQNSYLQFDIVNSSNSNIVISQSGYSCLESIDVYMGSVHIASTSAFNVLSSMLLDFQNSASSLSTSGTIYGGEDYNDGNYTRLGVTLATSGATQRRTVCLALPYALGTLAQKSIPLGSIREGLRVEIKVAPHYQWGK